MMLRRHIILGLGITLGCFQTAQADTACQMVDNILRSVSVIKDMDAEKSNRNFSETMFELEGLVDQISIPLLVPPDANTGLSVQREATFQYLSNMREAISASQSGYTNYAKQTLRNGLNREFTQSLETLEGYWNCTAPEETVRPDNESVTIQATFQSQPSAKVENEKVIQRPRRVQSESTALNRAANGGVVKQANLDRGELLKSNAMAFLVMIGFFALIGLFFYIQRRTKNFKAREARRLVQVAVKVRMGKEDYPALVVDISMNGLKMQHSDVIDRERKLNVLLGGNWHVGQIMWSNKMFAGIKFKKPIDRQTFNAVLK